MKKTVSIIGHRNPDTDSIASAMAYEEFKRLQGHDCRAYRLGTLNEETKFATRYFDVEAPEIIHDARAQIRDIEFDRAELIPLGSSCNDALKLIMQTNTRTLFVTDGESHLKGILSVGDLAMLKLNSATRRRSLTKRTNLTILCKDLNAKILTSVNEFKNNGLINIITETSLNYLADNIQSSICIGTANDDILNRVIAYRPSLIILPFKFEPQRSVIDLAQGNKVTIISSALSIIDITRIIDEAIPIDEIMTKKFVSYNENDYVDEVARKVINTRFRSYPILNDERKVIGAISRFHLFKYKPKEFILVDHSSKIQSIANIEKAEVIEIIDHHHIGDIQTQRPIYYRNQKVGCTCSIIYQMFKENGLKPSFKIAGMMLSAIISDTLYFKSETTTKTDVAYAHELALIANVDLDNYARSLLQASVNLKDADVSELIKRDLKQYNIVSKRIAVGQTNYANFEDIQYRMSEFKDTLKEEQETKGYDLIIMMFTHVYAEGTMFVYFGPLSEIMGDVIGTQFDENSGFDHQIVSRKQQLIPNLSDVLKERFDN